MGATAKPNLFIVGAAKSGTTAMSSYLGAHPEIFMSEIKEPSYFADDLGVKTAYSENLDSYLALFAAGEDAVYRGEASTTYLLDPGAARRIHEFCPGARIVILLRNPLEAMQAVFSEARKFALEPRRTFTAALAASDRGRPRLVARQGGFWTRYRDVVRYREQVERYLAVFPREQVFIGLYDDLKADPAGLYRQILAFLGLDDAVQPSFERLNPYRGDVRSYVIQRIVMGRAVAAGTGGILPVRLIRLRRAVARWNVRQRPRAPLDDASRRAIVAELRPEIERLGDLIGRDLSAWLDVRSPG